MKNLVPICGALLISLCPSSRGEPVDDILREAAATFPRLQMGKEADDFAKLHLLEARNPPIEFDGRRYNAIRFRTPETMDGLLGRMHMLPDEGFAKGEGFGWFIIPLERDESVESDRVRINYFAHHPRAFRELSRKFPKSTRVILEHIPLDPGTEYLFGFSSTKPAMPTIAVAATILSKNGIRRYGSLPTGVHVHRLEDPPTAEQEGLFKAVAGSMSDLFREKGAGVPPAVLDDATEAYYEEGGNFAWLHDDLEQQAASDSPDADPAWRTALWRWLYEEGKRRSYHFHAEEAAAKLLDQVQWTDRSARSVDAAAYLGDTFWRMGFRLRSSLYPDRGPGIPGYPEVRKREIPLKMPLGAPRVSRSGDVHLENHFTPIVARTADAVSRMYAANCQWQHALEWQLWIREASEASHRQEESEAIAECWFAASWRIAEYLTRLGFHEAADAEYVAFLEKDWNPAGQLYRRGSARLRRIELALMTGEAKPEMASEIDATVAGWEKQLAVPAEMLLWLDYLKGRCLAATGNPDEGLQLITRATAAGSFPASKTYVAMRSESGNSIPEDWTKLLARYRDNGARVEEWEILDAFADHLARNGRRAEEIAVRFDAAATAQTFNLHPRAAVMMAKLAKSLASAGPSEVAADIADKARLSIVSKDRIPERVAREVTRILESSDTAPPPADPEVMPVLLQPAKVETSSSPERTPVLCFSLTQSGNTAVSGMLEFSGMPVNATYTPKDRKILARISDTRGTEVIPVQLLPGTPVTIVLQLSGAAAREGAVTIKWSSEGQSDQISTCRFLAEGHEVKTMTARPEPWILDPFHGASFSVIHSLGGSEKPIPIRAVASRPARIQLSSPKNGFSFIDDQGNGKFDDPGDVLFLPYDDELLPTIEDAEGLATFRIQAWPKAAIPEDGLAVTVQLRIDGTWTDLANYRFVR